MFRINNNWRIGENDNNYKRPSSPPHWDCICKCNYNAIWYENEELDSNLSCGNNNSCFMKGKTEEANLYKYLSSSEDLKNSDKYNEELKKCGEYCMGKIMGLPDYCKNGEEKCNSSSATSFGLCGKCFTVEPGTATSGLNCE